MLEHKKVLNEIEDDELLEVAGGGTYTKDGYLKTTTGYSCGNFVCKECGRAGPHTHGLDTYYVIRTCKDCKWHTTLRCGNPANKK